MKTTYRKILSLLLATSLLFTFATTVAAEHVYTDDNGETYLTLGGYMLDEFGDKHSLDNAHCFIDFSLNENRALWMAVSEAIEDWNWHLVLISKKMSAQDGYATDHYNFGMDYNEVELYKSDIRFRYTEDYLNFEGVCYSGAYAVTEPFNASGVSLIEEVATKNANWRYSVITFSQLKFDNYAANHTEAETHRMMKKVASHEIGHALGLAHDSRDNGIIMYGGSTHELCEGYTYEGPENTTATVPTLHDLMAVYFIYR